MLYYYMIDYYCYIYNKPIGKKFSIFRFLDFIIFVIEDDHINHIDDYVISSNTISQYKSYFISFSIFLNITFKKDYGWCISGMVFKTYIFCYYYYYNKYLLGYLWYCIGMISFHIRIDTLSLIYPFNFFFLLLIIFDF